MFFNDRTPQSIEFLPLKSPSEDLEVHQDFNSQSGNSFGSVRIDSLTLSYTPKNMQCDSWASLSAHKLASPCLGRKPRARVATKVFSEVVFMFCK
jgi:hypothetical protein